MGKVVGEAIERTPIPKVDDILLVTVSLGGGKFENKFIQQITEKTIVVVWSPDKLRNFDLSGTIRSRKKSEVDSIRITKESLDKVQKFLSNRKTTVQNSHFKPIVWEKCLSIDRPALRNMISTPEGEFMYISDSRRVRDLTSFK